MGAGQIERGRIFCLFEHCIHLRETTPLERDVSHKYYAPGIGIIKDDEFELIEPPRSSR